MNVTRSIALLKVLRIGLASAVSLLSVFCFTRATYSLVNRQSDFQAESSLGRSQTGNPRTQLSNMSFSGYPVAADAFNESVTQSENAVFLPVIFRSDLNSGELQDFRLQTTSNHGINIVENPEGNGRVVQFDLRRTDPLWAGISHRTEIVPKIPREDIQFGTTYIYSFRTYIPEDWQNDGSGEHITQWHSPPDAHLGEPWRRPPVSLNIQGNNMMLGVWWDANRISDRKNLNGSWNVWQDKLVKGQWVEWKFEIKWSYRGDGILKMWRNGVLELDRRGPNTYNDSIAPFVKHGIYKPDWASFPHLSTSTHRSYFMDDILYFEDRTDTTTNQ